MLFDVVIIGAGPIGLACAIECVKENLSYIVLEKGMIVNALEHYPNTMTFFSTGDRLEIGGIPFRSIGERPKKQEAIEYYKRVAHEWNINIACHTEVLDVQGMIQGYTLLTHEKEYYTKKVIIATGYYDIPVLMNVPGEQRAKVHHYFENPEDFREKKVLVVGAANSAIDAAIECANGGAETTLIVRGDAISDRVKPWVRPIFEEKVENREVRVIYNATVKEILKDTVIVDTVDGEKEIENDAVLAMTGYQPNYQFLEKIGIDIDDSTERYPVCSQNYETSRAGIYIAGVICGGMNTRKFFIENSRDHANSIMKHIMQSLG